MEIIFESYRKTKQLHHAYLVEGGGNTVHKRLISFIENDLGIITKSNPDVWNRIFDKFGIDDGRELRKLQSSKPVTGTKRIFILTTRFFTHEAQNMLLKVFEEPAENVHFFIITPSADVLLPTLRSRLFVVASKDDLVQKNDNILEFLSDNIQKRLERIAPIIEKKDKAITLEFLDALEEFFKDKNPKSLSKNKDILNDMLRCRKYMYGNAPSVKMILEHLAIVAPHLK